MSPMRPTKRRRTDNATHTLSQPFKSPFKTPLKDTTNTQINTPTKSALPPVTPSFKALTKPTTQLRQTDPPSQNPTYYTLQKQHTHLLNHLSTTRTSLETSTQALKIESSSRETELEALIQKWRSASRAAAEEVFAKARDRVNKMGGVGAMREREEQSKGTAWGWDDGPEKDKGGGDGDGEDGAGFRAGEYEGDGREEGAREVKDEGGDEEGYTMDMMLKALNIELEIIGYDKGLQKWVD